jgi:hypothetical protein
VLARQLFFVSATDGVSDGFDLDGVVTADGDGTGCGVPDYVDAAGDPGIDNSFAALLDVILAVGGQAVPALVQNAVLSGELLLLFEVGTEQADGCRTIDVVRGSDAPAIGTDGVILPGQTFGVDRSKPAGHVDCARRQDDGSLVGSGLALRLPLHVFDETIDLTLNDGDVRLVEGADGIWTGVVGGGVSTAEVAANVHGFDAIPESLVSAIDVALQSRGDLDGPEGACSRMSTTIGFEAVPAFLFPDDEAPADSDAGDSDAGDSDSDG